MTDFYSPEAIIARLQDPKHGGCLHIRIADSDPADPHYPCRLMAVTARRDWMPSEQTVHDLHALAGAVGAAYFVEEAEGPVEPLRL